MKMSPADRESMRLIITKAIMRIEIAVDVIKPVVDNPDVCLASGIKANKHLKEFAILLADKLDCVNDD